MNRTDLILDVVASLGPLVNTAGSYVRSFIFENLDTMETFQLANPDMISGLGEYEDSSPVVFLTRADAERLRISLPGKGWQQYGDYGVYREQMAAAERVRYHLSLPLPDADAIGEVGRFDPWEIFPGFYGTYSAEFDLLAITILEKLRDGTSSSGETLAHELFREWLCNHNLADYGTSPRVCFATSYFEEVLPEFIEKWKAWSRLQWGDWAEATWPEDIDWSLSPDFPLRGTPGVDGWSGTGSTMDKGVVKPCVTCRKFHVPGTPCYSDERRPYSHGKIATERFFDNHKGAI